MCVWIIDSYTERHLIHSTPRTRTIFAVCLLLAWPHVKRTALKLFIKGGRFLFVFWRYVYRARRCTLCKKINSVLFFNCSLDDRLNYRLLGKFFVCLQAILSHASLSKELIAVLPVNFFGLAEPTLWRNFLTRMLFAILVFLILRLCHTFKTHLRKYYQKLTDKVF